MKPDLIIHNAKIYTVDPVRPWAEAVACTGDHIQAVGNNENVLALAGPETTIIDAAERLLLPGLTDAHVHFLQYAIRRHQVSLFGVGSLDEVRRRVRRAVESLEPGLWLQGWGWDEHLWDAPPSAALLDDIAPNTPVVLARLDMHTWWVNSAAMRQAGLSRETPEPPDGRIERDAAGNPNGILREWDAIRLVEQHIPRPDSATLRAWMKEAIGQVHRLGLTGIHDQRMQREGRQSFRLFQSLRRESELNLRVHMNIAAEFVEEAATLGLQPGFGDERLWLGHVKVFADGTMGSQTALMLEPFEDSADNRGIAVTPADELWELAVQAERAGYPLSVHAIGDRAVRDVLNVMSEFPRDVSAGQLPHRIEHVQLLHPEDVARLGQHGIFASVQPVHLMIDWRTADKVWGRRARYTYAFRTLLERGTQLAFGSDAPVAPINPMPGISAAVTRQDEQGQPEEGWYPMERLNLEETIYAYTMGPAHLAGQARRQGSITPGKWADMIMLEHNLFEIDPAQIAETRVEMTIFDGKIVFG